MWCARVEGRKGGWERESKRRRGEAQTRPQTSGKNDDGDRTRKRDEGWVNDSRDVDDVSC